MGFSQIHFDASPKHDFLWFKVCIMIESYIANGIIITTTTTKILLEQLFNKND